MKSRRLMGFRPHAEDHTLAYHWARERVAHRRNISPSMSQMGQKATLQADRRMSALPLTADIHRDDDHVSFGPIGDISRTYSITSSARSNNVGGTVKPSALAVLILRIV